MSLTISLGLRPDIFYQNYVLLSGVVQIMLYCYSLFQLAKHNKELSDLLKTGPDSNADVALEYYAKHTALIEVM